MKYVLPAILWLLASCTREDLPGPAAWHPAESTQAEPVDYLPVYPGQDAVLAAVTTYEFEQSGGVTVESVRGSALAVFPVQNGNYVNVGEVRSLDVPLVPGPGNRYAIGPSPSLPSGLNYITAPVYRWEVAGNQQFPAVSFICTVGFPVISELVTSATDVDRQADFTVGTLLPIDDADSVRFSIFAPNGYLFADKKGTQYSHTFTKDKLQLLKEGDGYIRITAFNSVPIEVNGKKIQYINQAVTSLPVLIH